MATKKKAAKSAKKPTTVKKAAPAKKTPAKPAHSSGTKPAKKAAAPHAKGSAKPVAKKVAPPPPAKKPVVVPAKKAVAAKPLPSYIKQAVPVAKPVPLPSKSIPVPSKPIIKTPVPPSTPPFKPSAHPVPGAAAAKAAAAAAAAKEEPKKAAGKGSESTSAKPEPRKILAPAKPAKVVIPEIKTKTVRKYEPEFTKSVLDTVHEEQTGPTMRYSDAELGEFRELINRKLDAAKKELAYLQGLITRKDEMGGDNDDARYMTMEDGSMSMEREQLSQMASRQITFIDHLEKAIMRIENKTYGICRVTGKLIDKARLRAVPHATLSIEAKQMMNK